MPEWNKTTFLNRILFDSEIFQKTNCRNKAVNSWVQNKLVDTKRPVTNTFLNTWSYGNKGANLHGYNLVELNLKPLEDFHLVCGKFVFFYKCNL